MDLSSALAGLYVDVSSANTDRYRWHTKLVRVPLKHVNIDARIIHANVGVTVRQEYHNDTDVAVSVIYYFPLDSKAGVHDFSATIGDRRVVGVVKEKEVAAKEFDDAVKADKTAALLSRAPDQADTWQVKIGVLPPHTSCFIQVGYVAEMRVTQGTLELHLPTSLAPRYSPGVETARIIDSTSSSSSVPLTMGTTSTPSLQITARFLTTSPVVSIVSPTHKNEISITHQSPTEAVVVMVQQSAAALSATFVLQVTTTQPYQPRALSVSSSARHPTSQNLIQFTFCPTQVPLGDLTELPQEMIFVVDRSGSMTGASIAAVKQAMGLLLRSLSTNARFNVISFGSTFTSVFPESMPYTDASLEEAAAQVDRWEANLGGTEILAPLQHVYKIGPAPSHPRQIFLLTDGGVTNGDAVTALVGMHSQATRVSVVGIGDHVSTSLVESVARAGRGEAVFIPTTQDVVPKIMYLMRQLVQPCLYDLRVSGSSEIQEWSSSGPIYGSRLGFHYAAVPEDWGRHDGKIMIRAKTNGNATGYIDFAIPPLQVTSTEDRLVIEKLATIALFTKFEHEFDLLNARPVDPTSSSSSSSSLPRLEELKRQSIECSIKSQILSRWTSSVLVHEGGPASLITIPKSSTSSALGAEGTVSSCCAASSGLGFGYPSSSAVLLNSMGSFSSSSMVNRLADETEADETVNDWLEALIRLQKSNGSWEHSARVAGVLAKFSTPLPMSIYRIMDECLPGWSPVRGVSEFLAVKTFPDILSESHLVTRLVVACLEAYGSPAQKDEWMMMLTKTRHWLSRTGPLAAQTLLTKAV
jgi:hypothetical protein